jgi:60 kDa SS-A/Ro ribonucleoprotein
MRTSNTPFVTGYTYNGAPTQAKLTKEQELRRAVLTCMLWEREFYTSGNETADRIRKLATELPFDVVAKLAVDARGPYKLRHVPLWLLVSLIDSGHKGNQVSELIAKVVQRPDEMSELLSLYWKAGKKPLTKQLKKGLAKAFKKFNEYSLAKFDKPGTISLRDVMFLSHPCPDSPEQEALFKRVANKELKTPDTWETQLSSGADKAETFVRLIGEQKLGPQAMLKNLRNMVNAGVGADAIRQGLKNVKTDRVLPFEFITAARYAKQFEPQLEELMFKCLEGKTLQGQTTLLLDVSASMNEKLSAKSELTRLDAAKGLAMLLREECENVRIFTFSREVKEVAPRRGFALNDAIGGTLPYGTYLGAAITTLNTTIPADRVIVLTDEESHDVVPGPRPKKGYMINVSTAQHTVGPHLGWIRVAGWSEQVVEFIKQLESEDRVKN